MSNITYLHTNNPSYVHLAIDKLHAYPATNDQATYVKEKFLDYLKFILTDSYTERQLVLAMLDDEILGISCYNKQPDHTKIDFVYKFSNTPHIGRSLVSNIISTTKSSLIKIDNIAGEIGLKCYTAAATACNYELVPNGKNTVNLTFIDSSIIK